MTIKLCDRCGKQIYNKPTNDVSRYAIFDYGDRINVRSISPTTQSPLKLLDLCPECHNKLTEFVKNEDVTRTYVVKYVGGFSDGVKEVEQMHLYETAKSEDDSISDEKNT